MGSEGIVRLRRGRDRRVRQGHPWVQRGDIEFVRGLDGSGEVTVTDITGRFLGRGHYHAQSAFPVRLLTAEDEQLDTDFFIRRFQAALDLRRRLVPDHVSACRLIYSEADRVGGLIADRYGDHIVLQVRNYGMESLRSAWFPALLEVFRPAGVLERSDKPSREAEGLQPVSGVLHGKVPDELEFTEHGLTFLAPVHAGLKTGAYFDQRLTRRLLAEAILPGDAVLDAFCYTSAFGVHAAKAGAQVVAVDLNEAAVEVGRRQAAINDVEIDFRLDNAFEWLETSPQDQLFDWIILDPPAIAKSKTRKDSLKWAIWKLVVHSLPRLATGGRLIVCNCSHQVTWEETWQACQLAGADAKRSLAFERLTIQDLDHPAPLWFPEALYLKCLWLRAD